MNKIYLGCMSFHLVLFYHGIGFSRCNNVFSLALRFPDSHSVMGYHVLVKLDCQMDSKLSEIAL